MKTVLLCYRRNRRSAARFQEGRGQCAGGKARTVSWRQQANALIDRCRRFCYDNEHIGLASDGGGQGSMLCPELSRRRQCRWFICEVKLYFGALAAHASCATLNEMSQSLNFISSIPALRCSEIRRQQLSSFTPSLVFLQRPMPASGSMKR